MYPVCHLVVHFVPVHLVVVLPVKLHSEQRASASSHHQGPRALQLQFFALAAELAPACRPLPSSTLSHQ